MAPSRSRDGAFRWRRAGEGDGNTLFPLGDLVERHVGGGAYTGMEFIHVNARSILNRVPKASQMPFRYTINAYRGCSHACVYCFARPTHAYLNLGIGEDFERKIVVKVNAVEVLRSELRNPRWSGEHVAMGTNTDPYQPAEAKYHLTRGIVTALGEARNPFSILTKSTLVLRDLELLASVTEHTPVRLDVSIGTLDRDAWRLAEPGTPPPQQRLAAVRRLNDAGIACGVLAAPILPGLSDGEDQVRALVEACLEAGAVSVTPLALHLRSGVREHVFSWLAEKRPDLLPLYRSRFAGGAYQDRAEQNRLGALTAAAGAAARPPGRVAVRKRSTEWREAERHGH